jgi:hypothetical protein
MKNQSLKLIGAAVLAFTLVGGVPAQSTSGISSEIQAYYDCNLLNILFVEFTGTAAANLLQHNKSINNIWQQDTRVGGNPVIDAIPGDGFNPVWAERQITFLPGKTPRLLCRDDDVNNAVDNGEIEDPLTGDVYWCPVIGKP